MPKVSVLLPVHNGARFLDDSIASVLAQDFEDFELIAIDDGSTDETPAKLESWAARDPRVILLRIETNAGISRALNAGLHVARGQYIARQDADDVCAPGRFAKEVAVLDAEPETVLICMRYVHIDQDGARLTAPKRAESPAVLAFLNHITPIFGAPGQSMFRTEAARAVGGWDAAFRVAQGWEFFTRVARHGRLRMLPDVGMHYRVHGARLSSTAKFEQIENAIAITQRELSRYLGRELSDAEARAVTSIWFAPPIANAAPLASKVMREAISRFAFHANREDVARVRELTAKRFFHSAAVLGLSGRVDGAARHLAYSLRWRKG